MTSDKEYQPDFIKKRDLAKLGHATHSLIIKNSKIGGKWEEAVDSDGLIDINNPRIQEWLSEREKVTPLDKFTLKDYEDLTIKEVLSDYGGIGKFQEFAKTQKAIADTEYRKLQTLSRMRELISREFVAKICFGLVNTAYNRLLEMPSGSVERIQAIIESDQPDKREQAEQVLSKQISRILKSVKKDMVKTIGDEYEDIK